MDANDKSALLLSAIEQAIGTVYNNTPQMELLNKIAIKPSHNVFFHSGTLFNYAKQIVRNGTRTVDPDVPQFVGKVSVQTQFDRILARVVDDAFIPELVEQLKSNGIHAECQVKLESPKLIISGLADLLIVNEDDSLSVYDVKLESMTVEGSIPHLKHLAQVYLYGKVLDAEGYAVRNVGLIRLSKVGEVGYITPHKDDIYLSKVREGLDENMSYDDVVSLVTKSYKDVKRNLYNKNPLVMIEDYSLEDLDEVELPSGETFHEKLQALVGAIRTIASEKKHTKAHWFE